MERNLPTSPVPDRSNAAYDMPRPDSMLPDRPPTAMTGEGRLLFQVSTAGGAIPLEGAEVEVRTRRDPAATGNPAATDGAVIAVLYTGRDGKTEVLSLPAPARSLSLAPARDGTPVPYALYDAEVRLPEFTCQSFIRIPVFDGVTSIQQASLIPLPENGAPDGFSPDGEIFTEGEAPDL